jgi:hypothetical protein
MPIPKQSTPRNPDAAAFGTPVWRTLQRAVPALLPASFLTPQVAATSRAKACAVRQSLAAIAVLAACLASPLCAQTKSLGTGPQRMEISLDRREADHNEKPGWKAVDPGLVFAQGDHVRFRFRTNFAGYLYVMIQSTSGKYETLFPRQDTGEENRVEPGKEYIIPSTQGSFRITGPAGQDILYWMVTPLPLGAAPKYQPLPPPPKPGPVPHNLIPRCDDTLFKARGECIDSTAGPRGIRSEDSLPGNLDAVPKAHSRELLFIREKDVSVVASPGPLGGPVIYEFRLAHR